MKIILLAAVLSQGCAFSKYAVTKPNEVQFQVIANNAKLAEIRQDKTWTWFAKPEDVVLTLAKMNYENQQQIKKLTDELTAAKAVQTPATKPGTNINEVPK